MDIASRKASLRIFLSYASEQSNLAEQIYQRLKNLGHRVFFDRTSLLPGREYDSAILKEIRASDLMVFLVSPHSIRDGAYARTELRYAQDTWKNPEGRVLPVMAEKTDLNQVPAYLTAITIFRPEGNIPAEVVAKVTDLASGRKPGDTPWDELRRAQKISDLKQRLTELDQQWERQQKRYQLEINGRPTTPSKFHAISLLALGMCFGVFTFIGDSSSRTFDVFFTLGWFIAAALVYVRLGAYQAAEENYLSEREDLLDMIDDVRNGNA
jgi:hypothetical protein